MTYDIETCGDIWQKPISGDAKDRPRLYVNGREFPLYISSASTTDLSAFLREEGAHENVRPNFSLSRIAEDYLGVGRASPFNFFHEALSYEDPFPNKKSGRFALADPYGDVDPHAGIRFDLGADKDDHIEVFVIDSLSMLPEVHYFNGTFLSNDPKQKEVAEKPAYPIEGIPSFMKRDPASPMFKTAKTKTSYGRPS